MNPVDPTRLAAAYRTALTALLAERTPDGHWVGELSTSALSTAVAVSALALVQRSTPAHGTFGPLIAGGISWLAGYQNPDGGWGDTVKSFSNISTTMLCRAAFHLTGAADSHSDTLRKSGAWLGERCGKTSEQLAEAVRARYGKDRTFSVPILMTAALAGLVPWGEVPPLPFELACLPQSWYRFARLPVVSYALPALIAIGQAVFHHCPPRNPLARFIRNASVGRSLRVLQAIQPANGGFLEATPLTSFVTLGLASSGKAEHPVVGKCVDFIAQSVRADGSWPIDTNLSTWVTTLAVNALAAAGELKGLDKLEELRDWLTRQQYPERHPFTGAAPGGWGWTPLPGSVPDADDTPGAMLALHHLGRACGRNRAGNGGAGQAGAGFNDSERPTAVESAVGPAESAGLRWLSDLQNRDGGWPTFCRGWGRLPFDRSGADLTAHGLRALAAAGRAGDRSVQAGLAYLERTQRTDGSWLPLWFGSQHAPGDENPTYGTARVLAAYRDLDRMSSEVARRGVSWLLSTQNADGGWGGTRGTPSSLEETALAVESLLTAGPTAEAAVNNALSWLVHQVEAGGLNNPTPIGFYFAKLWYFERLYPLIFTVAALGIAHRRSEETPLPALRIDSP